MQKLTDLLNAIPKKLVEAINKLKTKKATHVTSHTATEERPASGEVYTTAATPQESATKLPHVEVPPMLTNKANIKKFAIAGVVVLVLLVLVSVISRFMPRGLPNILQPSPTPTATPIVVTATPPPSKYATDEGLLKIEQDVQALDMEMGQVELDETNIRPRPLDFNVNFK